MLVLFVKLLYLSATAHTSFKRPRPAEAFFGDTDQPCLPQIVDIPLDGAAVVLKAPVDIPC